MEVGKSRLCLVSGEEAIMTTFEVNGKFKELHIQIDGRKAGHLGGRGWCHVREFGYFSVGNPLHFGDIRGCDTADFMA